MADGRTGSGAKEMITRLSSMGKHGLTVKTVVTEQPRARALSTAITLSPSVIAHRKSGFHSSLGRAGTGAGASGQAHQVALKNPGLAGQPVGQRPESARAGSGLAASPPGNESGIVFSYAGGSYSPIDVDFCLGLTGLLLVDDKDDTLIKERGQPFVSVSRCIDDLLRAPWRKFYQRPPTNTPGLLAIGLKLSKAERCAIAPCTNYWNCCACCQPCCCDHGNARVGGGGGGGLERPLCDDVEVLLTYQSNDIAVALNYCMQSGGRGDFSSSLHIFIQEMKKKWQGGLEKKLFVKWVGFDSSFPGIENLKEQRPISGQVAERLGYWPRYNFYDHCLDIMKGVYSGEINYDPQHEYGMGCWQLCTMFSYHWRGIVPVGIGWNQRDEAYYHQAVKPVI